MKKVIQSKMKKMTKVVALVALATLAAFTGCKSYDGDISNLQSQLTAAVTDVATLKTTVASLQTSVSGMTYIKSITLGTDGKVTITPSVGNAIVYDAKSYVTYDVALTNNVLTVNGVSKGTVAIPALAFGSEGKLMSGTTTVADLTSFLKSGLTLGTDNYVYINGQKSTILIPPAYVAPAATVTVKNFAVVGNDIQITYSDGTTKSITPSVAVVPTTGTNGNLYINGVDTKVLVKNTYGVAGGFLTVNGVATTVAIPAANNTSVIFSKDTKGNIITTTISDGKDSFTIKTNPNLEPLAGLLFFPDPLSKTVTVVNNGVNGIEVGYILNIPVAPAIAVKSLFTQSTVTYRLNPTGSDVSGTTWKILNNTANYNSTVYSAPGQKRAPGDLYSLFNPTVVANARNDGSQDFLLKVGTWNETNPLTTSNYNVFALEATYTDVFSGNPTKIVSDNVKVLPVAYQAWISKFGTSYTHYGTAVPAIAATPDFRPVYNATAKLNVNAMVLATAVKGGLLEKTLDAFNFGALNTDYKFVFTVPAGNIGTDGVTDDNAFIKLETNGDITILQGTASIGRSPYINVKLQTPSGSVLANAYIKLKIDAATSGPATPITYNVPSVTLPYASLFKGQAVITDNKTDLAVNWVQMNSIYTLLGVSHDQFNATYAPVTPTVTYSFTPGAGSITPVTAANTPTTLVAYPLVVSPNNPGVDTYAMKYQITPLADFGTAVLTYTYAPAGLAPLSVVFTYTVTAPVLDKALLAGYQYPSGNTTNVMTQGMNTGSGYLMQIYLGEAFGYGSAAYRGVFGTTNGLINGATHQFIFKPATPAQSGAALSVTTPQTSIDAALGVTSTPATGTLMSLSTPLTGAEKVYEMLFETKYPNNEINDFDYFVHFRNPLTIVKTVDYKNYLTDFKTAVTDQWDFSKNYDIQMLGTTIAHEGVYQSNVYGIVAGNSSFAYSLSNVSTTYVKFGLTSPSTMYWLNSGTTLTSDQLVGNTNISFTTAFAIVSLTDPITVKWDNTASPVKRK